MEYAGFWRRFAAYIIDSILISVVFWLAVLILGGIADDGGLIVAYILGTIGAFVYYAGMESSSNQATVGKIALGIQVTDLQGNRVSFGKALGRNLAKILSALILYIGFIMAAFTAKKQALHDMIAGTLVVKKGSTTSMSSADTPM
jgi:uncharacterized RDD family membrane protein YckC